MFTKLYDKCLKLASHKSANLYLSIVSFVESSFFPIPPDVMIVPMAIAKKSSYFKIFLNATIFSVLGGLLGYLIGFAFADLAMSLVEFYGYEEKAAKLKNEFIPRKWNVYLARYTFFSRFHTSAI